MVVRIVLPPGVDRDAAGIEEDRVVVLVIDDGVAIQVYLHGRTIDGFGDLKVTSR
jgi:hypothetical protein